MKLVALTGAGSLSIQFQHTYSTPIAHLQQTGSTNGIYRLPTGSTITAGLAHRKRIPAAYPRQEGH